ncbi:hypothetical protein IV102_31760 [bacterium]|nr:hypothetical protein [bacterium]
MLAAMLLFALTLSPPESRALELYEEWQEARLHLDSYLNASGQLVLSMSPAQADGFAKGYEGVFPVNEEGFALFGQAFEQADRVARQADQAGRVSLLQVWHESTAVQACFYSLMPVRGLDQPRFAGSSLFFVQQPRDASGGVFEQDSLPLDGEHDPGHLYRWDLQRGELTRVGSCAGSYSVNQDGTQVGQARAGEIWINDRPLLGEAPYRVGGFEVPREGRSVSQPSLSEDGQTVAFVCGTYVDRSLEDSGLETRYFLVIYNRRTGSRRVLAGPCNSLSWPQICGDGSQVLAVCNGKVVKFSSDATSARDSGLEAPDGPFQISRNGERVVLQGKRGFYQWDHELRPLIADEVALSADGNTLALTQKGQLFRQSWTDDRKFPQVFPGACRQPALSSDGRRLAFLAYCTKVPGCVPLSLGQVHTFSAWRLVVSENGQMRTLGGAFE